MSVALTTRPGLQALSQDAERRQLAILGGLDPEPQMPGIPDGTRTLLLLGPGEPGFWPHFSRQPEISDGAPDPIDRWSRRVIAAWASDLGGTALFPFDGPPYLPFVDWMLRSGTAWSSPVAMLVHESAGLMLSIRGALALPWRVELPSPSACPCTTCIDAPCTTACPVDAFASGRYDTAACHAHLDTKAGADCLSQGCRTRRACPVSQRYPRTPEQSAFHMATFHEAR